MGGAGRAFPEEVTFGPWRVRPALREIEGPDGRTRVKPKSMEVLLALLERPGELRSREDLLAEVWRDTFVTEEVLTQSVAQLRRAFGDTAASPSVIETVPRAGYRLLVVPRVQQQGVGMPVAARRRSSPLVGREHEWQEFIEALDRAEAASGGVMFLTGEPGIGKTRLAEEASIAAGGRRFLTLSGRCSEAAGAPPMLPFVEILERAGRAMPREVFRSLPLDSASVIARMAPGLRRARRRVPPPVLPPEQQRRHLFNAFLDFLERGCDANPLYLLLDDLQWADEATCLLLRHLALESGRLRLLIAGTFREGDVGASHPLRQVTSELIRQRVAKCLTLRPLSAAAIRHVLEWSSSVRPPEAAVSFFVRATGGNPFFLTELFEHLVEKHGAATAEWWRVLSLPDMEVPHGVRVVISQRMMRLADDTQHFLTSAAIVGRTFDPRVVREVACQPDRERFLSSVDEAESAGMIVASERGRGLRYEFTHDLIRHALLAEISVVRRQHLHLDVVRAMESVYTNADAHASDIVSHLDEAGDAASPSAVVRYSIPAAEAALEAAASEDALHHVERALARIPADDRQVRARLLFLRGYALRGLLRWKEALHDWREAIPIFEALDDAESMARVCREMSIMAIWRQDWDEAIRIAERGLSLVGVAPTAHRTHLLCHASLGHSGARRFEEGECISAEAEWIARQLTDPELAGTVLFYRCVGAGFYRMRARYQLAVARQCVELLRGTSNLWDLVPALAGVHTALFSLGRLQEMAACEADIERMAERVGHIGTTLLLHHTRAHRELLETGDVDAFAAGAAARCDAATATGLSVFQNQSRLELGQAAWWRGDHEEADNCYQEAGTFELDGPESGVTAAAHVRLLALLDPPRALDLLARHEAFLPAPERPAGVGSWKLLLGAVESLAVLGRLDRAASMHPLVVEGMKVTGAMVPHWSTTSFARVAGISAAAAGQWEEANAHFERAREECQLMPNVIEHPYVLHWWAWMLRRRSGPGDDARAGALLAESQARFRTLGVHPPEP